MSGPNKPTGGEALYVRTAAALRERIVVAGLEPGDVIEPERVLVEELGVSRITLRKAVDLLVADHVLVRRRGIGTFVASPKITYPLIGLHSTRDILKAHDLELSIEIAEWRVAPATPEERLELELDAREQVLRFVRRDVSAGRVVGVADVSLPERFAVSLTPDALTHHSTYELLQHHHGVRAASARQRLRALPASARIAGLLGVAVGEPVLELARVTYEHAFGGPIESGVVTYRHDMAECVIDLRRDPGSKRESPTGLFVGYPRREPAEHARACS